MRAEPRRILLTTIVDVILAVDEFEGRPTTDELEGPWMVGGWGGPPVVGCLEVSGLGDPLSLEELDGGLPVGVIDDWESSDALAEWRRFRLWFAAEIVNIHQT